MSDWTYCKDKQPERVGWYLVSHAFHAEPLPGRKAADVSEALWNGESWSGEGVYAWMPKPLPAPLPTNAGETKCG